jgi:glucose/arabinose dehydrogenase
MFRVRWIALKAAPLAVLAGLLASAVGQEGEKAKEEVKGRVKAPKELPKVPPPDPKAAQLPAGFVVEVVASGLVYPTSIEFDDKGTIYVAEAGFAYGDPASPARIARLVPAGGGRARPELVVDGLSGPVTDILWHRGRLYVSQRGKISVLEKGGVRDLVDDLPSLGDHHNNQMSVGPDGKIYFGQGTATNSGVVGMDNFQFGWLKKYPDVCDYPAYPVTLAGGEGTTFETPDPIALFREKKVREVRTGAFHPFGKSDKEGTKLLGRVRANGTILRMNPDGTDLEVYAWGLRNPFGVRWGPDKQLYVTDAGFDERGSRPIANAPDCLWAIKKGAWYGWPDYAGGVPVTDERFRPAKGPAPHFLLKDHPKVEKPLMTLPPHTGGAKFDFSPGGAFGKGMVYVALWGDMTPATGKATKHPGPGVARFSTATLKPEPFFGVQKDALGTKGFEHAATAGPRRPVAVRFSPKGDALYVVDFGAMAVVPTAVGPEPQPFPGTGVIWRIRPAARPSS